MYVGCGNRHICNQDLARHGVVAHRVIVRHVSLVTPEQVHAVPRCAHTMTSRLGPELVQLRGRVTAGKRYSKPATLFHGALHRLQQLAECSFA